MPSISGGDLWDEAVMTLGQGPGRSRSGRSGKRPARSAKMVPRRYAVRDAVNNCGRSLGSKGWCGR